MKNEWAIIGSKNGEVLLGIGPFQEYRTRPAHTTVFYHNTFALDRERPWLVPTSVESLPLHELPARLRALLITNEPATPTPSLQWTQPSAKAFTSVFEHIAHDISLGTLQKSVPVVTETAHATEREFLSCLTALSSPHPNLTPYGLFHRGCGFIGATPEVLFNSFEGKLSTMALAGTARAEDYDLFVFDQKEIKEHEFVAQTLQETLSSLGMTRRQERSVLDLGSIIHFHTAIDVELYNSQSLDALVKYLHPTPALGSLPRDSKHLSQLNQYRTDLNCPVSFGAPFGCYHEGRFRVYVAIRMINYADGQLSIPSGCGIIAASQLTKEWQELRLKRNSVKSLFQLD